MRPQLSPLPAESGGAHRSQLLAGLALAGAGAIAFSGKAIIIKLAYRHEVDPATLIMYRMLLALPFFVAMAWWAGRGQAPTDFYRVKNARSLDTLGLKVLRGLWAYRDACAAELERPACKVLPP